MNKPPAATALSTSPGVQFAELDLEQHVSAIEHLLHQYSSPSFSSLVTPHLMAIRRHHTSVRCESAEASAELLRELAEARRQAPGTNQAAHCRWCGMAAPLEERHACHKCGYQHDTCATFCERCGAESQHPSNRPAEDQVAEIQATEVVEATVSASLSANVLPINVQRDVKAHDTDQEHSLRLLPTNRLSYKRYCNISARVPVAWRDHFRDVVEQRGGVYSFVFEAVMEQVLAGEIDMPEPLDTIPPNAVNLTQSVSPEIHDAVKQLCRENGLQLSHFARGLARLVLNTYDPQWVKEHHPNTWTKPASKLAA